MPKNIQWLIGSITCVLFLQSVVLWVLFLAQSQKMTQLEQLVARNASSSAVMTVSNAATNGPVSEGNVSDTALSSSLAARVTTLEQKLSDQTVLLTAATKSASNLKKATSTTGTSSSANVKESYIFLGSGNTHSLDWTDIPSAQVEVDPHNFSHIKEVRFEAALSIIGGEVHARLVNKTTGAVYYESEISFNTLPGQWVSSAPISLASSAATYGVQLRSTSGETANLDGARLRVVVE